MTIIAIYMFVYGKAIPSSLGLLSIFVGLDTSDLSSMLIENGGGVTSSDCVLRGSDTGWS